MDAKQIAELATAIATQSFHAELWFYMTCLAIGIVSGACGSYIGSYLRKRGENFATRADFQEILRQLSASTKATESVKSLIGNADWLGRDWLILRRQKLELLVDAVIACRTHLFNYARRSLHREPATDGPDEELRRGEVICRLYFPELVSHMNHFDTQCSNFMIYVDEMRLKRMKGSGTSTPSTDPEFTKLAQEASSAAYAIIEEAVEVAKSLAPDRKAFEGFPLAK